LIFISKFFYYHLAANVPDMPIAHTHKNTTLRLGPCDREQLTQFYHWLPSNPQKAERIGYGKGLNYSSYVNSGDRGIYNVKLDDLNFDQLYNLNLFNVSCFYFLWNVCDLCPVVDDIWNY
jgi:hypothetical protein